MALKKKQFLKKRQNRLFLLFFAAASFVWLINSLNDTYTKEVQFRLSYFNLNENLSIGEQTPELCSLRLQASGFKLLALSLFQKELQLDLKKVTPKTYAALRGVDEQDQLSQFSNQLGSSVKVSGFGANGFVDLHLHELFKKKVPVFMNGELLPASNYFISKTTLTPDSIWIRGAKSKLSMIDSVESVPFVSVPLSNSIDTILDVAPLEEVGLSPHEINLKADLVQFSEKVLSCSIELDGIPEGYSVNFFPNKLDVVVAAPLPYLKEVQETDIRLLVSYRQIATAKDILLEPVIEIKNSNIHHAYFKDVIGVEYILTKRK